MREQRCGTCRYWDPAPWNEAGESADDCEFGECHRFPPTTHLSESVQRFAYGTPAKIHGASIFPVTVDIEFCGEWSPE